jgi:hypothetical protein
MTQPTKRQEIPGGPVGNPLGILRETSPTAWFADWLLADPPPWLQVTKPEQGWGIRIEGTLVKRDGKVWVLTGRKWFNYWEGKWPD